LSQKTTESTKLDSNSNSANNSYESGVGFFYQRYDISSLNPKTISKFKQMLDAGSMD
jgi:hypothetical protein